MLIENADFYFHCGLAWRGSYTPSLPPPRRLTSVSTPQPSSATGVHAGAAPLQLLDEGADVGAHEIDLVSAAGSGFSSTSLKKARSASTSLLKITMCAPVSIRAPHRLVE
jgi:hypothetical protein